MPRPRAETLGIASVADLARHAPEVQIGGDYEFFGRPEWRALRDAYGPRFAGQVSFEPTFLYTAVARDQVQVIAAFSSDGRLAEHDLVVLEEPAEVLPPYDAVLLLSRRAAADPRVVAALRPLLESIPVDLMREANHRVDRAADKQTVEQAARWLRRAALGS